MEFLIFYSLLLTSSFSSAASQSCNFLLKNNNSDVTSTYYQDPELIRLAANIFFSNMNKIGLSEYDLNTNSMTVKSPSDDYSSYSLFISVFDVMTISELDHYVELIQPQTSVKDLLLKTTLNLISSKELIPRQKRVLLRQLLSTLERNRQSNDGLNLKILRAIDSYNED